jgi:hypothetical protein
MLIPVPLAWQLHLPIRIRLGVLGMFLIGLSICICGALKTHYVRAALLHSYDETWSAGPIWILSALELDVGIICSCAPALRVIVREHRRLREDLRPGQYLNESSIDLPHVDPQSFNSSISEPTSKHCALGTSLAHCT